LYSFTAAAERRLLWLLALTQFTVIMDFMVMMPLGPQIMQAFQITPAAFATAVSAYSWCAGLSGLFASTYIDRFNRRSLLMTMYGLFALSNLACAFASSFSLLLIARAFAGITGGVIGSLIMAIVGDVIPPARRGAAAGTVMSAFSLAAVVGVPIGISLGAHFGWFMPFFLLFALSLIIGVAGRWIVPSLTGHMSKIRRYAEALPDLWRLISAPRHVVAFLLSFTIMVSQMLVIPFISPYLVANHGVAPAHIAWMYCVGGIAPFFTSRLIGRLADRYGYLRVLRVMLVASMIPVLCLTHLPAVPFWLIVALFPFFMVTVSGRMVPVQALLITVPKPQLRGAFLSANSSFQSIGGGCGAWLGGLMLSTSADGTIVGYGTVGWVAVGLAMLVWLWAAQVKSDSAAPTAPVVPTVAAEG
jgi:DHA1 family inner membrane transport protein